MTDTPKQAPAAPPNPNAPPPPVDPHRQSGRTTGQIKGAPKNALYIWPVASTIEYPKKIAAQLKRTDLRFGALTDDFSQLLRTLRRTDIIVDHACGTPGFEDAYAKLMGALAHLKG